MVRAIIHYKEAKQGVVININSILPPTTEKFILSVYPFYEDSRIAPAMRLSTSFSMSYPNLKHLELSCLSENQSEGKNYDTNLHTIMRSCPNLEDIFLSWPISKLNTECNPRNLKEFIVGNTLITEIDLSFLKGSDIETVILSNNRNLKEVDLTPLLHCHQLKSCALYGRIGRLDTKSLILFDDKSARERVRVIWGALDEPSQTAVYNHFKSEEPLKDILATLDWLVVSLKEHRSIVEPTLVRLLEMNKQELELIEQLSMRTPEFLVIMKSLEQLLKNFDNDVLQRIVDNIEKVFSKISEEAAEKGKAERAKDGLKAYIKSILKKPAVDYGAEKVVIEVGKKIIEFAKIVGPIIVIGLFKLTQ